MTVLTIAVGVGVVPGAALLAPRPSKLGSAETPPDGVAAARQRPDHAAAAHCNTEEPSALCWEHGAKLTATCWVFSEVLRWAFRCCPKHSNCCVYLPKHPKPLFPAIPQSPARRLWLFTRPPAAGQIRTLAQRVVEVAGSALVTRVPFKSRSTQTLPCLAVTGAII